MIYKNYDITIAVTRRCNARCMMCNQWADPTRPEEEITVSDLERLPAFKFVQITGGEPFVRDDISKIIGLLHKRAKRVLINTNGYYTEKILRVASQYPKTAFRVSIDGMEDIHNKIRGIPIYSQAIETLKTLRRIGIRDLGISYTLQESNYIDLIAAYRMALEMGIGFSCTVVHNSFYFDKKDNTIEHTDNLRHELQRLVREELKSNRIKDWGKAFMNYYNISYMDGKALPIKCDAAVTSFYIDSIGNILPCNMTSVPWVMGSLKEKTWDEIMQSDTTKEIIVRCKNCRIPCWSMCNVQTAIKKHFWIPMWWLLTNKFLIREKRYESK